MVENNYTRNLDTDISDSAYDGSKQKERKVLKLEREVLLKAAANINAISSYVNIVIRNSYYPHYHM